VVDDEPAVLVSAPVESVKVETPVKPAEVKPEPVLAQPAAPAHVGEVTSEVMIATWPQILNKVSATSKPAWVLVAQLKPVSFIDEVLTLQFKTAADVEAFKNSRGAPDILRSAITSILGVTVKFKPAIAPVITEAEAAAVTAAINVVVDEAEVAEVVAEEAIAPVAEVPVIEEPIIEEVPVSTKQNTVHEGALYGESLLRDVLGAVPVDKKK
jgi:DNA polymerase-3 subunit gamma/tau